jgi:hypothetical protein
MEESEFEAKVFQDQSVYTDEKGTVKSINLDFVDIPAGTLLFRGMTLPDTEKGGDARLFLQDFLGEFKDGQYCLSPTFNVFFYPSPYVALRTYKERTKYNAIMVYQTNVPIRMVCMISPSKQVRSSFFKYKGTAPVQRCDSFPNPCRSYTTEEEMKEYMERRKYDNCINPTFAKEEGVLGWMAIASFDSLDAFAKPSKQLLEKAKNTVRKRTQKQTGGQNEPKEETEEEKKFREAVEQELEKYKKMGRFTNYRKGKDTRMGEYLYGLKERGKGFIARDLLSQVFVDNDERRGFPEIVVYPHSPHPGDAPLYTDAADEEAAANAVAELSDTFSILPVACVTATGVLDAFSGDFLYSELPPKSTNVQVNSSTASRSISFPNAVDAIERNMKSLLDSYRKGKIIQVSESKRLSVKMMFDSRTGFFVLDRFFPKNLSFQHDGETVSYESLLMPLETDEQQARALEYRYVIRNFVDSKFLNDYILSDGTPVKRAAIFNKPKDIQFLYKQMDFEMPPTIRGYYQQAATLYQKNQKGGTRKKQKTPLEDIEVEYPTKTMEVQLSSFVGPIFKNVWARRL